MKNATWKLKNVTLMEDDRFPNAVTTRGTKHLHDLMKMKQQGHRAVLLFLIQRSDGKRDRSGLCRDFTESCGSRGRSFVLSDGS